MKLQVLVRRMGVVFAMAALGLVMGCATFSGSDSSGERWQDPPSAYDAEPSLPAPTLDSSIRNPAPTRTTTPARENLITDGDPPPRKEQLAPARRPAPAPAPEPKPEPTPDDEPEPVVKRSTAKPTPSPVDPPTVDEAEGPVASSEIVRVGDILTIEFSGPPDPPPRQSAIQVTKQNSIKLPQLSTPIKVVGLSTDQISQDIADAYIKGKLYRSLTVNVSVGNRYYSVGGEVRRPDKYLFTDEMTVLKAINQAGGLTDFADKKNIYIIRDADKSREKFDYKRAQKNPQDFDKKLLPGDQVFVERGIL